MNAEKRGEMPTGVRDSQSWYLDVDPFSIVDHSLVDYVYEHGGAELLDLGCGLGGYAKLLESRGRKVMALDVNEAYVSIAKGLGIDARVYDGRSIPLPDQSVDTIFMIEVMEHIANPESLIPELKRVARRNVIVTVPNCTRGFRAPVVFHHMLDADHKNFFTRDSLHKLLAQEFPKIAITEVVPMDDDLAADLLPPWFLRVWRLARRRGWIQQRWFFRLIAEASTTA